MEQSKKNLAILNLTGTLSQELADYFSSRGIFVTDSSNDSSIDWTHILTNETDFEEINKQYEVIKNDRRIISLSKVNDLQKFVINNGNLILDDCWFQGPMGPFIMDKYFQGYGGINLGDNYPTFKEIGSFNVVNPFFTGEYLDRMVEKAFAYGSEALAVKTYFDHLIMYVAGLKTKGKAGLPFEITYGHFEDIFAVQVHFFSQELNLSDVVVSLKSDISKKAEEYYLNTAVQSADFFDFSYLPEVNKVTITALWTRDNRINFENRGLMISSLLGGRSIVQYESEIAPSSMFVSNSPVSDFSGMIEMPVPQQIGENNNLSRNSINNQVSPELNLSKVRGNKLFEEKQLVKGQSFEEDQNHLISGQRENEENANQLISGQNDTSIEEKQTLQGDPELDETQTVNGFSQFEENGNQLVRKLNVTNSASLFDSNEINTNDNPQLRSGDQPDKEEGLNSETVSDFDFLNDINRSLETGDEDLTSSSGPAGEEDLLEEEFSSSGVSKLSDDLELIRSNIFEDLVQVVKGKIEEDTATFRINGKKLDPDNFSVRVSQIIDEVSKEKNFKVKSLGPKIAEKIKSGLFDFAKNMAKDVDDLSDSELENFSKKALASIVKKEVEIPKESLLLAAGVKGTDSQLQLEKDLQLAKIENSRLKLQLKTVFSEVKILKESKAKLVELQRKAIEKSASLLAESSKADGKDDDELKMAKAYQAKLSEQQELSQADKARLAKMMERQSQLITSLRQVEAKSKKLEIEGMQKENLFVSELEQAQKQLKNKDLMVLKTKEALTQIIDRKDQEINKLKYRIDEQNDAISKSPVHIQAKKIKDLEGINFSLNKQIEGFKSKIASLSANLQTLKSEEASKEESQKIQMLNQQIKNQSAMHAKETEKMRLKMRETLTQFEQLRAEKQRLEKVVEKTKIEQKDNAQNTQNEAEIKKLMLQNQKLETQLKDSSIKISHLENKLIEAAKAQKATGAGDEGSKVKVNQLEGSLKKLTQDLNESKNQLGEAKKEVQKLKQEKVGLQNQIDKLKKDNEKTSKSAKAGGKAA